MKRYVLNLFMIIFTMLFLTGCSNQQKEEEESIPVIDMQLESQTIESTETEAIEEENRPAKRITIEFEGIKETYCEKNAATPIKLEEVSIEDNGIDFANEWYEKNNMSLPMNDDSWQRFHDDKYNYEWVDEELSVSDIETGNVLYKISYPTDVWYVNGNNARIEDGILYAASVYNGYAQPNTCFMFAYDLEAEKLLWRSADQTYNTMNFVVKDDVIICGYGFTSENDYLYELDKNTGKVIEQIPLKKAPDLMVEKDGKLYVHTYSYNYIFEIKE